MRFFLALVVSFLISSMSFAQQTIEPVVKSNVVIMENATPSQCQAAANGQAGPMNVVDDTRVGQYTGTTGPGVRSCTGCGVDPQSQNCVCSSCYYYFN